MCRGGAPLTVLLGYALFAGAAYADETRKPPAEDPDPSFLEFLGGVDGLAEANPDYLAQGNAGRPLPGGVPPKPVTPPPPPPSAGLKNNE